VKHPLRCRCGKLQGHVVPHSTAVRAICYCKDCQAYARFLRTPETADRDGGTEVIAMLPQHVHFASGLDALACISLSERGLLRWYASCCSTPIGNTPRNPKLPYAGLVHNCLEGGSASIEASFGRSRIAVNTKSARNDVRSTPIASTFAVVRLMSASLGTRFSGAYRNNPFFAPGTDSPIRSVRVLSASERAQAYDERER
jgi:hypothetical protein